MFSIFSLEKNSTGIFDKFVLFISICTTIFIFILAFFTNIEYPLFFNLPNSIGWMLILGRVIYDSNFDYIYFLLYNFITQGTFFILETVSYEITSDIFIYYLLFISLLIFRIFFNSYIFQYCKLKSYKNKEICSDLL